MGQVDGKVKSWDEYAGEETPATEKKEEVKTEETSAVEKK